MSEQEHDGNLGESYRVHWHYDEVVVEDEGAEYVGLTPKQALSLLAWLVHEQKKLEQLAQEQEGGQGQ